MSISECLCFVCSILKLYTCLFGLLKDTCTCTLKRQGSVSRNHPTSTNLDLWLLRETGPGCLVRFCLSCDVWSDSDNDHFLFWKCISHLYMKCPINFQMSFEKSLQCQWLQQPLTVDCILPAASNNTQSFGKEHRDITSCDGQTNKNNKWFLSISKEKITLHSQSRSCSIKIAVDPIDH